MQCKCNICGHTVNTPSGLYKHTSNKHALANSVANGNSASEGCVQCHTCGTWMEVEYAPVHNRVCSGFVDRAETQDSSVIHTDAKDPDDGLEDATCDLPDLCPVDWLNDRDDSRYFSGDCAGKVCGMIFNFHCLF